MISRRSQSAENDPPICGAPIERAKYAPLTPQVRPRMNAIPQITSAEPTIRIPAWRSDSPKKRTALPSSTSATTRQQNLTMSPNEANRSRGMASQLT
jgi:hypothetical protein